MSVDRQEQEARAVKPRTEPPPRPVATAPSAGQPAALSALAAMLLRLHATPPVYLVEPNDEHKSRAVPPVEQGSV
jgi:hypothetical protein